MSHDQFGNDSLLVNYDEKTFSMSHRNGSDLSFVHCHPNDFPVEHPHSHSLNSSFHPGNAHFPSTHKSSTNTNSSSRKSSSLVSRLSERMGGTDRWFVLLFRSVTSSIERDVAGGWTRRSEPTRRIVRQRSSFARHRQTTNRRSQSTRHSTL